MNAWWGIGISLLLNSLAYAQPLPEREVTARMVDEGFSSTVPISGRPLAGAMFEHRGKPNGKELFVWVPQGMDIENAELCLSLLARDGRYTGLLRAPLVAGETPFLLHVTFESREPAFYAEDRSDVLTALAEVKQNCAPGHPAQHILPVSWERPEEDQKLAVMINSSRMQTFLVVPYEGKAPQAIECDIIPDPQRIAFDRQCLVDISELREHGEPQFGQTELVRLRGPNRAPPVPFPLAP
ncbi:hypothetical protein [Vreelandella maris]|jgi:hypothetical protein|uniref:Uncharacterized protein n=1 Tax=Vreelandella maris TaxID=2729617 RepID=A0A7Y6V9Q3_9GAMM|nr:hypothetical protein [Halomonas maris]NVF15823.1 hypothetical protein [Halomonas maris]|tara:strand:+ start:14981 stop:15700 length:720 start_codon:yes stop_codon:yes gene_type:complete